MKIKDILAIVAMALMTGGCNSSDDTQSDDGRVPIRLTASVESRLAVEACTRGTTTAATQDETLLEGQTVKAVITMEGTEYTRNYTVGTGDVLTTDETPKLYYPMNGSPVSIYAVHPSYTSGTDFTVAIDQRDDALYAASDLCYSKTTSYKKADWNKLTFEHLLSKVVVNITNSINSNAISSVQLNACIRTSLTYPVDNSGGYTLGDASIPNTVTLNPSAAAIIPPQTISEGTVLIDFTIPDVGFIEYTLPTDVTFESGHQYTYNITVSQTGITVTSSINPWGGDATTAEHTYTGYATPVPRNIKMNPLWYVAPYNVTSSDGGNTWKFATSLNEGYFYSWDTAMKLFTTTANSVSPSSLNTYNIGTGSIISGWHLPIQAEWFSIVPGDNVDIWTYVSSSTPSSYKIDFITSIFGYDNSTKTDGVLETSYWRYVSDKELRAIRFLGTNYCSAWKYVWNSDCMTISATLIDVIPKEPDVVSTGVGSLAESWYNSHSWDGTGVNPIIFGNIQSANAAQIGFYGMGWVSSTDMNSYGAVSTGAQYQGYGVFWSSTEIVSQTTGSWGFYFNYYNSSGLAKVSSHTKANGRNVRLFRDN